MEGINVQYFKNAVSRFHTREEGAVTVDWVVITSAVVGMGLMVLLTISSGAKTYAMKVNTEVENIDVAGGE